MLYAMHEARYYATQPLRAGAKAAREFWGSPLNPASQTLFGRSMFAGAELIESTTRRYGKPAWNIDQIMVGQTEVRVRPTVVWESPWCRLIQFDRDMADMRRATTPPCCAARWRPSCPTTRCSSPTGRTPATCR
jgi:poly(3-hydroxybutyrate) depolymerase